ncbi:MAG: hypothetical protein MZU79_05520 [Anaerotruncus sp.]|nr:hypothetical protein [Anaerotruncus sp.]
MGRGKTNAVRGKSGGFVDRLAVDLATGVSFTRRCCGHCGKVRSELAAIRDVLIQAFPDDAIVLTGSMFVGEGQVDFMSGHPVILSDYDLIVVSRNVGSVWPPAADGASQPRWMSCLFPPIWTSV